MIVVILEFSYTRTVAHRTGVCVVLCALVSCIYRLVALLFLVVRLYTVCGGELSVLSCVVFSGEIDLVVSVCTIVYR